MKRLSFAVVFVALLLGACGRGEPDRAVRANASSGTASSAAVATTAPPTTEVPTTAPPTTVPPTTAPPTTVGPFSVRDITVSMQDCRHGFPHQGASGATYGCLGTFVVRVNPGIGGELKWSAAWDYASPCDEPRFGGGPPRMTDGVIAVPTGATEVTGKLATFWENDINPRLVLNGAPATLVSKITVTITNGGSGSSKPTPFYGDGDCTKGPGLYTSPSMGSAVEYP